MIIAPTVRLSGRLLSVNGLDSACSWVKIDIFGDVLTKMNQQTAFI
jgi:hypothetical protein